jgi:hypothetical protein
MDWTQHVTQLFKVPKPAHFTNYRHCCECAEHDATLLAHDVHSISFQQLGNPGWDPLCFTSVKGILILHASPHPVNSGDHEDAPGALS